MEFMHQQKHHQNNATHAPIQTYSEQCHSCTNRNMIRVMQLMHQQKHHENNGTHAPTEISSELGTHAQKET